MYYIDIKEGNLVKKYVLDEYVEKIKVNNFFSGFIEINAMSIILNRPIVILEDIYYDERKYYKKFALFNNSYHNSLKIEDIIFINFQNNNHYELLTPKNEFLKNRINKITEPDIKELIIVSTNNNQSNKNINNLSKNKDDHKIEKKEKPQDKNLCVIKERNSIKENLHIVENKNIEITLKETNLKDKKELPKKNKKNSKNKNVEIDINLYNYIIQNYNENNNTIRDENDNVIQQIPKYPILIGDKINEHYYADIFRYLYAENNNLNLNRYSDKIKNIKKVNSRNNKKRVFRKKIHTFYLDNNNILYKKKLLKGKDSLNNKKILEEKGTNYILLNIPETLDILNYLQNLHKEEGHRGISSLREYLYNNNIYFEGSSFLTEYIVKTCKSCAEKNKTKYVREPSKQIITYYPKQRYIMDLTEIPIELKSNNNFNYLFNIIDHFSKFGISIPVINKEAKTILESLKIAFECNGFPEEIGSDNGKEFKNTLIEGYLKEKNIKFIHGMPYNPHSQGVVERFHKTIKDYLYSIYSDDKDNFDLRRSVDIVVKKYNNHKHRTTKYTPNQIFYSSDEALYSEVLENMKKLFKSIGSENANFKVKEKCLLKCKFIIKKACKENNDGVMIYNKVKNKINYRKLNVIIVSKNGSNYRIKISKNYPDYKLKKDDIYLVDYKLLNKCSSAAWDKLLKESKENNNIVSDESFESNESIGEEELKFIMENNKEYI